MPEGVGYSDDYAGDIAELMSRGQTGDVDAQAAVVKLAQRAESGDVRMAKFLDDAAGRIKGQRHVSEGSFDTPSLMGRLGELTGEAGVPAEPTDREQQLLGIIQKLMANRVGAEAPAQMQGAQAGPGQEGGGKATGPLSPEEKLLRLLVTE